ncbi:uncharacterized protein LOC141631531 [Silene latifolia]|uniref:uncharacterized protein LOC141631531 n=1 Tax=Silene latifolia TaxID=37657 RepID=UPI003D7763E5
MGPSREVRTWKRYSINGYNFRAFKDGKDVSKATLNNGVCVSSTEGADYYGTLDEVIELTYTGDHGSYVAILFKCDWLDNSARGMVIHEQYKLVDVNRKRKYTKYEPFVLAYQVEQLSTLRIMEDSRRSNRRRSGEDDDELRESPPQKLRISIEYKWFEHPEVSKLVTKTVKGNYHEHGPNWSETKPARREQYWKWFKSKVDYPKDEEDQVRAAFTKLFKTRLRTMVCRAVKKQPKWMGDALHAELLFDRQSEEGKKKSAQAQANRKSNAEGGKALGTHTMGRMNSLLVMEKLANGGDYPPAIELLKATKTKKTGGYVSKKAEDYVVSIEAEISALQSQGETDINKDKIYLEKCGFNKKGLVFGTGAAREHYFERSATGSRESNNIDQDYSPGILPRLVSKNVETELRNKVLEDKVQRMEAFLQAKFGSDFDPNCDSNQFQNRDDFNDDGGSGNSTSIPTN